MILLAFSVYIPMYRGLGQAVLRGLGKSPGGDNPINRGSYKSLVEPLLLKLGERIVKGSGGKVRRREKEE